MPELLEWSLAHKEWPIKFAVDVSKNDSPRVAFIIQNCAR